MNHITIKDIEEIPEKDRKVLERYNKFTTLAFKNQLMLFQHKKQTKLTILRARKARKEILEDD